MFPLFLAVGSLCQTPSTSAPKQDQSRPYQYFGSIVGRAGDVDRDGVPDILIGDSGYPGLGLPPLVWIVSGANGSVLHRVRLPVENLGGTLSEGSLRICLDGGLDLDGDGVPDFVAGVTSRHVDVVSGKTGQVLSAIPARFQSYDSVGWVRLVTDLDGDGLADIGILTPNERGKESLRFLSGKTHEEIVALPIEGGGAYGSFCELTPSEHEKDREFAVFLNGGGGPSLRIYSSTKKAKTWERMLEGGDRSPGRGAALEAIGTRDQILVGYDESVAVIRISDHARRFHVNPQGEQEGVGQAVAAPGDLDGDGVPDFIYSIWDAGMYNGMVVAKSGKDGHTLWSVTSDFGSEDVHHLGEQLAVIGDIDGDGIADLAVATNEGPATVCPGSAAVYSGRTGMRLFFFRREGDDVVVADKKAAAEKKR